MFGHLGYIDFYFDNLFQRFCSSFAAANANNSVFQPLSNYPEI